MSCRCLVFLASVTFLHTSTGVKPYQTVRIEDCGEDLVAIPLTDFSAVTPHPYVALGAPYGSYSPYYLRRGVLQRLIAAQSNLQTAKPNWRLQIFDAYRPVSVQQFMVDYTFAQLARDENLASASMSDDDRTRLRNKVAEFWATPSADPHMPPPHSTGAAVDLTLIDERNQVVDMGSAIDEISPRSYPDHFAKEKGNEAQRLHHHRQLLAQVMAQAGFRQHPKEWWHFSLGDQLWAWQEGEGAIAIYGSAQAPNASGACYSSNSRS